MHLNQTVITFSDNEKYELQTIMGCFRPENSDLKLNSHLHAKQDLQFKESIVNFIKSKKIDLQEKQRCIERIREFLAQEKCIPHQQNNLTRSFGHDQLCSGLQNLRLKIVERQKNHEVFELFVCFMEEMKELKEDKIYEFQYKLSKATKLSRLERQTLALIAKKIVKVESLSKMNDVEDQIIGFFSKIIRYGINQQFKELEKISNLDIKNKCYKLLEYLQNNCIEIRQEFSPVRSLLKKLSTSIYDKFEIDKTLSELPQNQRLTFEPVCAQIFRLRDGASRSSLLNIPENNVVYMSHDMKKAQQLSLETVRRECDDQKKKNELLQAQLKRIKLILEKFSYLNNLFKEQSLYVEIEKELALTGQQIKAYLERIYQHLKSFEELSLGARKASFVERKDKEIQFLQEKLHYALQKLDSANKKNTKTTLKQSLLLDENSCLKNESQETTRIFHEYHEEMNSLNKQINENHEQITQLENDLIESQQRLQAKIKENDQMAKQIENLLNLKKQDELRETQITISRQMLEQRNKCLQKEKLLLTDKIQMLSIANNKFQEKIKDLETLKHFEEENSRLITVINQLNKKIQENKASQQDLLKNHEKVSSKVESKSTDMQLKKLKEENQQLKQERMFRLSEEAEMKRMFQEERRSMNEIKQSLDQYKEKYDKLNIEYQRLSKQKFEGRLWESERKIVANSSKTLEASTQLLMEKSNIKRMQEKHHLLQKNFQEVKKYNELIKGQYQKLKQETNSIIKSKINEVFTNYKEQEVKMKQQILQLTASNEEMSSKVAILQEQNLNLKVQMGRNSRKDVLAEPKQRQYLIQSMNLKNHQKQWTKEQYEAELKDLKVRNQEEKEKLKRQIKSRQEKISIQRIQILRLQQKLNQQLQFQNYRMPERNKSPTDQLLSSSKGTKYLQDRIRRKSEMKRKEDS